MKWLGDFKLGDTFDMKFTTTAASTGAPTTLSGSPVISAYPGNSTTELTAGITLTVDFDARTGLNNVRVVATAGNGYAAGTNYQLVITTGTVGGTSAVGYVVGEFSIENRVLNLASVPVLTGPYPAFGIIDSGTAQAATSTTLQIRAAATFADSTGVGATAMVFGSNQGYWQMRAATQNVGSTDTFTVDAWDVTPTGTITYILFGSAPFSASLMRTAIGLASANLDTQLAAIQSDTDDIQTRIPASLTAGRMNVNVTAVAGVVVQTSGSGTQNIGGP